MNKIYSPIFFLLKMETYSDYVKYLDEYIKSKATNMNEKQREWFKITVMNTKVNVTCNTETKKFKICTDSIDRVAKQALLK